MLVIKAKNISKTAKAKLLYKAKKGDLRARDELIESILKYVVNVAKSFYKPSVPCDDLVGEAVYCVMTCWYKWNPRKSAFITYMGACVRNHLKAYMWQKEHRGIFIPRSTIRQTRDFDESRINKNKKRLQELRNALYAQTVRPFKIDFDIAEQEAERNEQNCLGDLLPSLTLLTKQERKVVSLRAGLDGPVKESKEIAKVMRITSAEVGLVFNSAIKKMKEYYATQKHPVLWQTRRRFSLVGRNLVLRPDGNDIRIQKAKTQKSNYRGQGSTKKQKKDLQTASCESVTFTDSV